MEFNLTDLLERRLPSSFYSRSPLIVARELLGQYFVVTQNGILQIAQITETEAYHGPEDLASHARFGKTNRNQIMWGPPGRLYVYQVYGIHYLLNIISQPEGSPSGVLIRSLAPLKNISASTSGPARLTKTLNIDKSLTGLNIIQSKQIFIAQNPLTDFKISTTPRIGINYAPEPWRSLPWRFIISP